MGNGTLGGVPHAFILERFEGLDTLAPIVSGSVAVTTGYPSSAVTANFWDNEKVVGATTSDNLSRLYNLANSATLYRYTAGASGNGMWATLAGILTAGSTVACMSFDGGDRIVAFVGTTVWIYSISGNGWTQLGTAPIAPARAILGADGLVYLIQAREIWAFDPVVNTIAKMGTTNYDESAAIVLKGTDGFLNLIGGNGSNIETFDTRATTTQTPVITSTPTGTTLPQSTPWSYTIAAGGKPRPTYSLVRGPAGMTVGATTGAGA